MNNAARPSTLLDGKIRLDLMQSVAKAHDLLAEGCSDATVGPYLLSENYHPATALMIRAAMHRISRGQRT